MLTVGLVLLGVALVGLVAGWLSTNRQIRGAGGEPREGRYVYASEGGVSGRTAVLMLAAWVLAGVGALLVLIALVS